MTTATVTVPGPLTLRVAMAGTAESELDVLGRMLADEGFAVSRLGADGAPPGPEDADLVIVSWAEEEVDELPRWWSPTSDVQVAVLLRPGSHADAARLLDEGAVAVWSAPGPRKAVALVRSLLRRHRPRRAASPARRGDLVLDPATGVIRVGDKSLRLEGKRLEIAAALLGVPTGSVATHSWLRVRTGLSQAQVEGHVRRLRAALEATEGWRRIESVRGLGYRVLHPPDGAIAEAARPSYAQASTSGGSAQPHVAAASPAPGESESIGG